MRIELQKQSDERHVLRIVRDGGATEQVECDTRSYLHHDLLHFATEVEARLDQGFWGNLAKGKTLAQMNDRTGKSMASEAPAMMTIEQVVGALSGIPKGVPASTIFAAYQDHAKSAGFPIPAWFTLEFAMGVEARMRSLLGRWKATPYGESMVLSWPPLPRQPVRCATSKAVTR